MTIDDAERQMENKTENTCRRMFKLDEDVGKGHPINIEELKDIIRSFDGRNIDEILPFLPSYNPANAPARSR